MSGWVFLAIGAAVTALDLLAALYLLHQGADATALDARARTIDGAAAARAGRIVMLVSPLFFLVFAALAFGLVPIDAIDPITLN